jgi:serine/threonine protein kinase
MSRSYNVGEEPIPGFRLQKPLGRGGFGEVWKATAPGGTEVALKIISLENKAGFKEFRAIRTVKKVLHPNLVPIVAFWLKGSDGQLFTDHISAESSSDIQAKAAELIIAMTLGEKNLLDRLNECKTAGQAGIPVLELLDYMESAAKAIDYLNRPTHDLGSGLVAIQHCDIKPQNIMIVGGSAQVCDFGLARVLGDTRVTSNNAVSMAYTSPELFSGDPSQSSDQYSLGVTYCELRTGKVPFDSEAPERMMYAHISGKLNLSALPANEQTVIKRATDLDPTKRYPTTVEMVRELFRATNESSSKTPGRASRSADMLQPGSEIIPGYKLVKLLGKGSYGTVWEVTAPGGKHHAMKVIRNLEQVTGKQEFKALELIKNVEHTHLLELYAYWLLDRDGDIITDEARSSMESPVPSTLVIDTQLATKNLIQRLHECQREGAAGIPPAELLGYMRQAADAIDYLNTPQHHLGERAVAIQHRDIKPENILLARGGVVKVGDFGLAKVVEGTSAVVHGDSTGMTPAYAAPELFESKVTAWSDQYSLALTYYKLRTGKLPFDAHLPQVQLMLAHVEGRLDIRLLPEQEQAVIKHATMVKPEERFPSCMAMVEALGEALAAERLVTLPERPRSSAADTPLPTPREEIVTQPHSGRSSGGAKGLRPSADISETQIRPELTDQPAALLEEELHSDTRPGPGREIDTDSMATISPAGRGSSASRPQAAWAGPRSQAATASRTQEGWQKTKAPAGKRAGILAAVVIIGGLAGGLGLMWGLGSHGSGKRPPDTRQTNQDEVVRQANDLVSSGKYRDAAKLLADNKQVLGADADRLSHTVQKAWAADLEQAAAKLKGPEDKSAAQDLIARADEFGKYFPNVDVEGIKERSRTLLASAAAPGPTKPPTPIVITPASSPAEIAQAKLAEGLGSLAADQPDKARSAFAAAQQAVQGKDAPDDLRARIVLAMDRANARLPGANWGSIKSELAQLPKDRLGADEQAQKATLEFLADCQSIPDKLADTSLLKTVAALKNPAHARALRGTWEGSQLDLTADRIVAALRAQVIDYVQHSSDNPPQLDKAVTLLDDMSAVAESLSRTDAAHADAVRKVRTDANAALKELAAVPRLPVLPRPADLEKLYPWFAKANEVLDAAGETKPEALRAGLAVSGWMLKREPPARVIALTRDLIGDPAAQKKLGPMVFCVDVATADALGRTPLKTKDALTTYRAALDAAGTSKVPPGALYDMVLDPAVRLGKRALEKDSNAAAAGLLPDFYNAADSLFTDHLADLAGPAGAAGKAAAGHARFLQALGQKDAHAQQNQLREALAGLEQADDPEQPLPLGVDRRVAHLKLGQADKAGGVPSDRRFSDYAWAYPASVCLAMGEALEDGAKKLHQKESYRDAADAFEKAAGQPGVMLLALVGRGRTLVESHENEPARDRETRDDLRRALQDLKKVTDDKNNRNHALVAEAYYWQGVIHRLQRESRDAHESFAHAMAEGGRAEQAQRWVLQAKKDGIEFAMQETVVSLDRAYKDLWERGDGDPTQDLEAAQASLDRLEEYRKQQVPGFQDRATETLVRRYNDEANRVINKGIALKQGKQSVSKRYLDVLERCSVALDMLHQGAAAARCRGMGYSLSGDDGKALDAYDQFLGRDSRENWDARSVLLIIARAELLLQKKDPEYRSIIADLDRASKVAEKNSDDEMLANALAGIVRARAADATDDEGLRKRYREDAIENFQQALQIRPNHFQAPYFRQQIDQLRKSLVPKPRDDGDRGG